MERSESQNQPPQTPPHHGGDGGDSGGDGDEGDVQALLLQRRASRHAQR